MMIVELISVLIPTALFTSVLTWSVMRQHSQAMRAQLRLVEAALEEQKTIEGQLRTKLEEFLAARTESATRLATLQEQVQCLLHEKEQLIQQKEAAHAARFTAEKHHSLIEERLKAMQRRIEEWEKDKETSIQHAKAAIFEVGNQLSGKLIEEHKRHTEEAEQRRHTVIQQTTEHLHAQFSSITQAMAALDAQVKESRDTVDLVRRSLLSPGGAGHLAEITLENIFHASGLTAGRDFQMQYTVTEGRAEGEGRLRPDAVVFLPGGNVLVVDSKASKFFLEMEMAAGTEQEKGIQEQLKATMRHHIKSLSSKDYQEAVRKHLGQQEAVRAIHHISVVMFLPSEVALEKLQTLDADCIKKAWEQHIFPAGPTGLINILSHARFTIRQEQQQENHRHIMEEVQKLLGSLAQFYEHARKVGVGLQSAANHYDKLAGSFNANLLPKARKLQKLGIQVPATKTLPKALDRYQMVSLQEVTVIENETEASEAEALLELEQTE